VITKKLFKEYKYGLKNYNTKIGLIIVFGTQYTHWIGFESVMKWTFIIITLLPITVILDIVLIPLYLITFIILKSYKGINMIGVRK
jgi:hypothetical protein